MVFSHDGSIKKEQKAEAEFINFVRHVIIIILTHSFATLHFLPVRAFVFFQALSVAAFLLVVRHETPQLVVLAVPLN